MKPYEVYIKFANSGMVYKFKRNTLEECHAIVCEMRGKYPEQGVFYRVAHRVVIEQTDGFEF